MVKVFDKETFNDFRMKPFCSVVRRLRYLMILLELKDKFEQSEFRNEKIKTLTVMSNVWCIKKVSHVLETTLYTAC